MSLATAATLEAIRQINTLTAERDAARRQLEISRARSTDLESLIAVLTAERDEARALGRIA